MVPKLRSFLAGWLFAPCSFHSYCLNRMDACLSVNQMVYHDKDDNVRISGHAEVVRLFRRSCIKASSLTDPEPNWLGRPW